MELIRTKYLSTQQKEGIYRLWNNEYARQLAYTGMPAFDAYLNGLTDQEHYLMLSHSKEVLGWAFTFMRDSERWFTIILDGSIHGQGHGAAMLDKLKEKNDRLCGWVTDHGRDIKADGMPYRSPLAFYIKNGFMILPDVRLELEVLSAVKIVWERTSPRPSPKEREVSMRSS